MRRIGAILVLLTAAAAASEPAPDALRVLVELIQDPARSPAALAALRATEDKDAAPVFVALSRSGDRRRRLFGAAALHEVCGKDAAGVLAERLARDPVMAIRADALGRLLDLQAASPQQLAAALRVDDERVRLLAARGLVACGQARQAAGALGELSGSTDPGTAALARVLLLATGDAAQEPILRRLVSDPKTSDELLGLILAQVASGKVTAAMELTGQVAWSRRGEAVRVLAFQTLSALSPKAGAVLVGAIEGSSHTVFRVRLLAVLSSRADAAAHLPGLCPAGGAVGALARMELARPGGGEQAGRAVLSAVRLGHPVVIDYVLNRARKDLDARGKQADFYTHALLEFIRSVEPAPAAMGPDHFRAARAASLLVDLGTPAAMAGLRKILSGRHSAVRRAVGAGLLRAKNRTACELARGLLSSSYEELAADAALTLGRFNDPAAAGPLRDVLAHPRRHRTEFVALAAWYLLRGEGRTRTAAKALAEKIK